MRRIVWIMGAGAVLLLAVCGAAIAGTGRVSPPPGSYRTAVEAALARRSIEHQGVRLTDGCAPSYQFCRHYRADVVVFAPSEYRGEVLCRWRWTGCALTIQSLGVRDEPLPDVVRPLLPWDLDLLAQDLAARIDRMWR